MVAKGVAGEKDNPMRILLMFHMQLCKRIELSM
jgi:hypothetical protein